MSNKVSYKTNNYTIPANGQIAIERRADLLTCLEADADFVIRFNDGSKSDFMAGLTFEPDGPFENVVLINETATDNVVKLAWGQGRVRDSRLNISGSINSKSQVPDVLSEVPPINIPAWGTQLVAAANPKRKELFIYNDGVSDMFIIGTAVGARKGIRLGPGGNAVIETTDAVYIYNYSAVGVYALTAWTEFS